MASGGSLLPNATGLFTVGLRDDDCGPAYKFPALPHRARGRCLFPSQAAYEDPAFPEEQLRMLASKTSIKDRFRQVADEANRIRDKHLFTLTPGDVTHPKLAQLDELHIHLVMPKVVKESYDDLIQGETMTFSRFIEEIQGLQADRPQSLTLL